MYPCRFVPEIHISYVNFIKRRYYSNDSPFLCRRSANLFYNECMKKKSSSAEISKNLSQRLLSAAKSRGKIFSMLCNQECNWGMGVRNYLVDKNSCSPKNVWFVQKSWWLLDRLLYLAYIILKLRPRAFATSSFNYLWSVGHSVEEWSCIERRRCWDCYVQSKFLFRKWVFIKKQTDN